MVIYLKHPQHGTKVAISEEEAAYDKLNGWTVYRPDLEAAPDDDYVPEDDLPLAENLAPQQGEPGLDAMRAQWAEKFGKQPHHRKNIDTLRKELNGVNNSPASH